MKVTFPILAVLATALAISASNPHDSRALGSHHAKLLTRSQSLGARSINRKRCKTHSTGVNSDAVVTTKQSKHNAQPSPTPQALTSANGGIINVKSSCGTVGATRQTTRTSGPNGSLDWLNCGLNDNGWNPPFLKISDIVYVSLSAAISSGHGPFLACTQFAHLFEKYGGQHGIPPILLASFALQESSCKPNTIGGAGEQGLMQITKEKCVGAPGGNCLDPEFNIATGTKFFAETLSNNGGNLLLSIGSYNGWYQGLTYSKATAAAKSNCCRCQNNCDYLHQFLNGWLQNIDAYNQGFRLGKYFNLDICH